MKQQPFIPAKELKQDFGIYGHFYSVELASKEVINCRSVLEIIHHDDTPGDDLSQVSDLQPDAVFIMMNPGSSKPLTDVNNFITEKEIGKLPISLVPTRPDTTQYQVMRLMHYRNWRHVRVLNLSDLRSPKSPIFIKMFQRLEAESNYQSHSIFAKTRTDELAHKLGDSKKTPLVLAWGVSDKLTPLIERCLARIPTSRKTFGLLAADTTNKYRHPLPSLQKEQRLWVDRIVQQFEEQV